MFIVIAQCKKTFWPPIPKKSGLSPNFQLTLLLESLTPEGDRDRFPPPLASQVLQSALSGRPYRVAVLQRAIERYRAEIGRKIGRTERIDWWHRDARAALIKAFLNRWKRFHPDTTSYEEIRPEMNPNNESPGYLLGSSWRCWSASSKRPSKILTHR